MGPSKKGLAGYGYRILGHPGKREDCPKFVPEEVQGGATPEVSTTAKHVRVANFSVAVGIMGTVAHIGGVGSNREAGRR